MLRSLQQVYGARKIRGCTIIDAPPFFETAGREEPAEPRNRDTRDEGAVPDAEERHPPIFWGDNKGPVVMTRSGTACFRVNRRVQRRFSRKKTIGSSGGSNPHEVLLESERERTGNFRRPPFLNNMG